MTIAVLYFAALRELLGKTEETLSLAPGPWTVEDLARYLVEHYPALGPHLGSVRFAINEVFVNASALVSDGDRVALLPPVSGG